MHTEDFYLEFTEKSRSGKEVINARHLATRVPCHHLYNFFAPCISFSALILILFLSLLKVVEELVKVSEGDMRKVSRYVLTLMYILACTSFNSKAISVSYFNMWENAFLHQLVLFLRGAKLGHGLPR